MKNILLIAIALCVLGITPLVAAPFDGAGDLETDAYGYYYIITGGKFPTGTSPNGDNASGGTFRFLTDDPAWGYTIDQWKKDDWFTDNASFALTLKNGDSIVYDNNGLEDNSYGDYYNGSGSHGLHGLYRGYSMSNNWDWIYSGYFELKQTTTFDTIIGYFDANGGALDPAPFDPYSSAIQYNMNIWSNIAGDLLPVNTGGFSGDIFASDIALGSFSVSDTGAVRIIPNSPTDPIYRLTYTLESPVTLDAGVYWFSHDAEVVPEPGTFSLFALGLASLGLLWKKSH